jgi:hypothetical protein
MTDYGKAIKHARQVNLDNIVEARRGHEKGFVKDLASGAAKTAVGTTLMKAGFRAESILDEERARKKQEKQQDRYDRAAERKQKAYDKKARREERKEAEDGSLE